MYSHQGSFGRLASVYGTTHNKNIDVHREYNVTDEIKSPKVVKLRARKEPAPVMLPKMAEEARLLDSAQVALMRGTSARTLREHVKAGLFPRADYAPTARCVRWSLGLVLRHLAGTGAAPADSQGAPGGAA